MVPRTDPSVTMYLRREQRCLHLGNCREGKLMAAKKAPAKKAAAKKAPGKEATAKKAPAEKASARKRAPAKKATRAQFKNFICNVVPSKDTEQAWLLVYFISLRAFA